MERGLFDKITARLTAVFLAVTTAFAFCDIWGAFDRVESVTTSPIVIAILVAIAFGLQAGLWLSSTRWREQRPLRTGLLMLPFAFIAWSSVATGYQKIELIGDFLRGSPASGATFPLWFIVGLVASLVYLRAYQLLFRSSLTNSAS